MSLILIIQSLNAATFSFGVLKAEVSARCRTVSGYNGLAALHHKGSGLKSEGPTSESGERERIFYDLSVKLTIEKKR